MSREIESIKADFRVITKNAVESGEGIDQIYTLCQEVEGLDDPPQAFPVFFELMERLPDSDLGSPVREGRGLLGLAGGRSGGV